MLAGPWLAPNELNHASYKECGCWACRRGEEPGMWIFLCVSKFVLNFVFVSFDSRSLLRIVPQAYRPLDGAGTCVGGGVPQDVHNVIYECFVVG